MSRGSFFLAGLIALSALSGAREARAQLFVDQGTGKLGAQACGGSGCWSNYARVTDFNADGFLDLVIVNTGGFFSNPIPQPLVMYANDGAGNFTDVTATLGFTGGVRQVAFGDIDNDGDIDIYVPAAGAEQPDALFVHDPGTFTNQAATRLPAGLSSDAGATRFGDFDNDGDLDLIVADGYLNDAAPPARLYLNDGTGTFAAAPPGAVPTAKLGLNPDDIDLADVDGDFDLDIYINMHEGDNSLWINNGDATFTDASASLPPLGSGSQFHYGPVFCDVDGDGDRDLFIDNTGGNYTEQLLVNDGSGEFTNATGQISGNGSADDNLVSCIDHDGDGDLDFVVGSLQTPERLFANDGSGNFSFVTGAFSAVDDPTLWMEFGDLNGDGRLDALSAQGEGNPQLERIYFGGDGVAVDTVAPRIIAVEAVTPSATDSVVVRFAVSDNAVTDEGPRLSRAYLLVGAMEVPARFMGGDLYRAVIPPTSETTFTACAVDWAGNLQPACGGNPTTSSSSSGVSTGQDMSSGSAETTSGSGGSGGADGGGEDGSGGCDCRAGSGAASGAARAGAAAAILIGLAALLRGRRERA
jgi:hypothetical protein